MELGDLIYILIMVAVAIFSIVKKSISKKQSEVPIPQYNTEDYREDVFPPGVFWEGNAKPLAKPPENKEMTVRRSVFKRIDFDKRRLKSRISSSSSRLKKTQKHSHFLEEEEQGNVLFWEVEQFELQKAIIYSEILKRSDY